METNATSPLIVDIPATQLKPNPANPRKSVGDVTELAASIKAQGLQQQLLVTPAGNDKDGKPLYRIVIGYRRYQACIKAGLSMIPCTIRDLTDREEREIMLIENTQRADLTPIEEADGYQGLLDLGASIDELADKTGRSASFVRRRIKIAGIPQTTRGKAKDFCYPPQRYVQNVANMRHLWILDNEPRFGWKQPTGHAPEPGHDNDDNEQPSHHGGIQQIIIGGES